MASTITSSSFIPRIILSSLIVVLIGTSGCSSDDAADVDPATKAVIDAYGRQPYSTIGDAGPLAHYLGQDDLELQAKIAQQQNATAQASIESCMRGLGFDYVPWVPPISATETNAAFGDITKAKYAKKWGFGISTVFTADGTPIAGTVDPADTSRASDDPESPSVDPNIAIRDALDPARQAAYDVALNGPDDSASATGEPSTSGCHDAAYNARSGLSDADSAALESAYRELNLSIENDKRTRTITSEYRSCMKTAGYPNIKDPQDAWNAVSERMAKLYQAGAEPTDPGSRPIVDAKELRRVQTYELQLASADLPCRAVFDTTTLEIQRDYEKPFIAKYKTLLDKSKAADAAS